MIASALGGLNGLRRTVAGLGPGDGALRMLGSHAPCRSTLADANRNRDPGLFFELFKAMLPNASRGERRDLHDAVRLIDSTQINLGQRMRRWVGLHRNEPTAKLHTVYDPRGGQPVHFALTPAKVSDIAAARARLPIEPYATYVFDRAYFDFAWFARLQANNCIFVTRLKSTTWLRNVRARDTTGAPDIVSDSIGTLPNRLAASRRNPFAQPGREIVVRLDDNRSLRLFTNDLDSPARTIADLYKERWQIELFFKWIKQNLRIDRFMGSSENAVRIQIATALIAYLLIRLAHARLATQHPASIVLLVVRGQLFARAPIAELLMPPRRPIPMASTQLAFALR